MGIEGTTTDKEAVTMPQKRALVVAVNDYGGTGSNNLPSCINDANAFVEEVLKRMYQFNAGDIRALHDADATINNVETELDRLTKDATPDDRLVFYFSGHGFTQLVDNVMEEFLVLRESAGPALYGDNQFVAKVKDLPTGVFTAVLDMCFSGGAFKNLTLDAFGTVKFEPTLVKALPYPPEKDQQKEKSFAIDAGPVAYKRFGCVKTERPSVLAKVFTPEAALALGAPKALALSDITEAPQPEMSGVLISACLETETASASNSLTRGLSAFTFGMLEALKSPSTPRSATGVFNVTAAQLQSLGFRQTPMLLERAVPGNLAQRGFITLGAVSEAPLQKDFQLAPVDEKLFGGLVARFAQLVPQVAPIVFEALAGQRKAATLGGPIAGAPADADEKFIGAVLGTLSQVLPRVAPVVLDAIMTRRKALEAAGTTAATADADEKFLGAILGTVAQVIPHVAPMIIEAVAGRRKSVEVGAGFAPSTSLEAEEKFIGSILGAVSRVIPRVTPIIIDAVVARRKELDQLPADTTAAALQADPKFIGAILGTLGQVMPHVAPLVLDAIAGRRKALGGFGGAETTTEFEADEKFLGAVFRTIASTVPFVVPRIVDAVTGRQKAFEGVALSAAMGTDADEKFLGAVLNTLTQVIPHVAPVIIDSVFARRKELELETGTAIPPNVADEKFLGLIVGAVATVVPHVAPLIVDAVRGRRKELDEGLGLGAIAGAQAEEKLFGDILRRARQVLPSVASLAPPMIPVGLLSSLAAPRKDLELGVPAYAGTAAEGAVDEKFLGAVMSALGQVLPVVTPAIINAIGKRKDLELPAPPPATETDEKFIGAVMSALGQVLPIVTPAVINAIQGQQRRKELAAASPGSADEKLIREVMNRLPQELPQWFGGAASPATFGRQY
jgi:hypothetical protein